MHELNDRWYYYLKKTNPDFNNMGMDQQGEIITSLVKTGVEPIIPDRFEIVFRIKWYHVYGFEKDSTVGHSYGKFHYKSGAETRLRELKKIFKKNT
jgi:hypothetical protein